MTSSENQLCNWSVRVVPPDEDALPRSLFAEFLLPQIQNALINNNASRNERKIAWINRGWRKKEDFDAEVSLFLESEESPNRIAGMVIARAQTEEEADEVIAVLAEVQIQARKINQGNPPLLTSIGPPPSRDFLPEEDEEIGRRARISGDPLGLGRLFRRMAPGIKKKTRGTKKSLLESLPKLIYAAASSEDSKVVNDDENLVKSGINRGKSTDIPLSKVFLSSDANCSICIETLKEGEVVTCLPCGHYFHVEDTADCSGINKWLVDNNSCPNCRETFEAEPEKANEGDGVGDVLSSIFGGAQSFPSSQPDMLICPVCKTETLSHSCSNCGVKRNIASLTSRCGENSSSSININSNNANDLLSVCCSDVFRQVEDLFFQCVTSHSSTIDDNTVNRNDTKRLLEDSIALFMHDKALFELEKAGWRLRGYVETLLQSAMLGKGVFEWKMSSVDRNSDGLFTALLNRLSARLERSSHALVMKIVLHPPPSSLTWTCPLCNRSTCSSACACGVKQTVMSTAAGYAASVFNDAEDLFLRAFNLYNSELVSLSERNKIIQDLSTFLTSSSSPLSKLEMRGWVVHKTISSILHSAVGGGRKSALILPVEMDINSRALVTILIRRLQGLLDNLAALTNLSQDANTSSVSICSTIASEFRLLLQSHLTSFANTSSPDATTNEVTSSSKCPVCLNVMVNDSCSDCGVHVNVHSVARGQAASTFDKIERLFARCIDLHNLPSASLHLKAALSDDIDSFLSSNDLPALAAANWCITHSVTCLLNHALRGSEVIPFCTGMCDSQSRGLYAILVNTLRTRITTESIIQLSPPTNYDSPNYFENVHELECQTNVPTRISKQIIIANSKLLMRIAFLIAKGGNSESSAAWMLLSSQMYSMLSPLGLHVEDALSRMYNGEVSLSRLTDELDGGSASLVEAVLNAKERIIELEERELQESQVPIFSSTGNEMITKDKALLEALKKRLKKSIFSTIVKALIKLLDNIRINPEERKYRRLKLDNKIVQEYIAPHDEVMQLLRMVGFEVHDGLLEIASAAVVEAHREEMSRILLILQSFVV